MKNALRLFSYYGLMRESVDASAIPSREYARKLGPFVDQDRRMLYWRGPSFDKEAKKRVRRSHFAHFPALERCQRGLKTSDFLDASRYNSLRAANSKHRKAQELITKVLKQLHSSGQPAEWHFKDPTASEFSFSGDLLSEVTEIKPELPVTTPFGEDYRFDIALLGPPRTKSPNIVGAIEVEFTHEFDSLKCLIGKALACPLISVDISDVDEHEITEDWCRRALLGTTTSDQTGRRINFVYLHDMLYPAFVDLPDTVDPIRRHQFIIVVREDQFDATYQGLRSIKRRLGFEPNNPAILIQPVTGRNPQATKVQENEASIAGINWAEFNSDRYIRVTADRPAAKTGRLLEFHLLLTRFINTQTDALVGFKYTTGLINDDPEVPYWTRFDWQEGRELRVLPKQVGQPVEFIKALLASVSR